MIYPDIDPVAFHIFSWPIYWYGITYLAAFATAWIVLSYRAPRSELHLSANQISDLVFFGALGAVVGGRLGFVFFYGYEALIKNPWFIVQTWKGGMSFHGGLLGVLVALARMYSLSSDSNRLTCA